MNRSQRRRREKLARRGHTGTDPAAALRAATTLHRAGQLAEAEQAYRRMLTAWPDHPDATHLLGVLTSQTGHNDEALALLAHSLELKPGQATYHFNHAKVLEASGRPEEAADAYRVALSLAPDNAEAFNNLGNVLHQLGDVEGAISAYRQALAVTPTYHDARRNLLERLTAGGWLADAEALAQATTAPYARAYLGRIARLRGQQDQAIEHFRRCLALDASDPFGAALELAAAGATAPPARPPAAYVRRVYDEKASGWDTTTADPSYRGHALMQALITDAIAGRGDLDILDLGCGTGALAAMLRPSAKTLVGVDLAPAMIAKARSRQLYDRLATADAIGFMAAAPAAFDIVVAAAVLIHFADLAPALAAAARCLRPGGSVACTLFKGAGTEVETKSIGGFIAHAHSPALVRAASEAAGLAVRRLDEDVHEHSAGAPVAALTLLLQRPQ